MRGGAAEGFDLLLLPWHSGYNFEECRIGRRGQIGLEEKALHPTNRRHNESEEISPKVRANRNAQLLG
jgi:hypothetical protein